MNKIILILVLVGFVVSPLPTIGQSPDRQDIAAVQKPVLFWSGGGCSGGYCQTGWYSSPAVANLDADPQAEVIGAAYSIYILDGLNGSTQAMVKSGHDITQPSATDVGRTWPDVVLANLDGVGTSEIVTAHSGGWVSAYTQDLNFFSNEWPKQPTPDGELRSLGVSDLDHDGKMEILVASTRSDYQWYAYEPSGAIRTSYWPQHFPDSDTNGWTAGCYNQNLAAGDLDGDGRDEIVGPNDTHYIAAFQDNGQQMTTNTMYGLANGTPKVWARVGVHVEQSVDLRGYANCGIEHRPNFANSAPIIVDVDGNGSLEAVVIGNVYNCTEPYTDLYEIPFIFNADRTRWNSATYDWTVLPNPEAGSAPLSEDYNVIENSRPNPSAADIDNDGHLEIIYPSYDGRVHVYWLDKTEHGSWPYSVKKAADPFLSFASEAAVADLNGDGQAEVIFTSWTQIGSNRTGKLHILSSLGVPIWEVSLPTAMGGANWNGALAAPTLANIDLDPDLEVIVNTAHSGLVAYHLPGTSGARILWGTGRGSYLRSGSLQHGYASHPTMIVNNPASKPGEILTYTIVLSSLGKGVSNASFSNTLPAGLVYSGGLIPAAAQYLNGTITWNGNLSVGQPVTIQYQAQVAGTLPGQTQITNTAQVNDGNGAPLQIFAKTNVNFTPFFLPVISR